MEQIKLEVCCGDMQSVLAAKEGGADRIELCQALEVDGLTPSAEMMAEAIGLGIPVQVLIRPREGDFVYDEAEVETMLKEIRLAKRLGANGVVIGVLKPDGSIDEETIRRLVSEATGLSITFHRAFDVCSQPAEALEQIVSLGCHRLLTSGQAPSAEQGIPLIKKLVRMPVAFFLRPEPTRFMARFAGTAVRIPSWFEPSKTACRFTRTAASPNMTRVVGKVNVSSSLNVHDHLINLTWDVG